MTAGTMLANDQQRYKYGGGILTLSMGAILAFMMMGAYESMTSWRVEFHLYLKSLPAIPHPIMVGLWWFCMAASIFIVIISLLPSVVVVTDDEKIVAQSIYTRKFKTVYYRDILDMVLHKSYISITDQHNNKIYLAKLFMTSNAFKAVALRIQTFSPNTI